MSDQELMQALQCCAPNHRVDRNCAACPLNRTYTCHTELVNAAITAVVTNRSKAERLSEAVAHAESVVASLRLCC